MKVLLFSILLTSNIVQFYFLLCMVLYLFLSFVGIIFWRKKENVNYATSHRFALLIPAHNEENVIGNLLESINILDYPKELYDVYVVVDHSSDKTVDIVKRFSVNYFEFNDDLPSNKARALNYATQKILSKNKYDAFCYFDADSLVHPNFLKAMSYYLSLGYKVIQAQQIPKNPRESIISLIISAGQFITNKFFQKPKKITGLSATFHGKGLCFSIDIVERYKWDERCLTEDLEMQMRLISEGVFIMWGENAIVYDEEPLNITQYFKRSVRWTKGSLYTAKKHALKLFVRFIREFDFKALEAFLYTIGVYRTVMVFFTSLSLYFMQDRFNILLWAFHLIPYDNVVLKIIFLIIPLVILPVIMWVDKVIRFDMLIAYYMQPLLSFMRVPIFLIGIFRSHNVWDRVEHTSVVRISDVVD